MTIDDKASKPTCRRPLYICRLWLLLLSDWYRHHIVWKRKRQQ